MEVSYLSVPSSVSDKVQYALYRTAGALEHGALARIFLGNS
jgi:hypothetical protein